MSCAQVLINFEIGFGFKHVPKVIAFGLNVIDGAGCTCFCSIKTSYHGLKYKMTHLNILRNNLTF